MKNAKSPTCLVILELTAEQVQAFSDAILDDISNDRETDADRDAKKAILVSTFNAIRELLRRPTIEFVRRPAEWEIKSFAAVGELRELRRYQATDKGDSVN